jgi:hypothetical protein
MSAKPPRIWSPKKWKLYLLAAWFAGAAFWIPVAYDRYHMEQVMESYRLLGFYQDQMIQGYNRDYMRRGYQRAGKLVDDNQQYMLIFLFNGFLVPLILLGGGAWLLRNAK